MVISKYGEILLIIMVIIPLSLTMFFMTGHVTYTGNGCHPAPQRPCSSSRVSHTLEKVDYLHLAPVSSEIQRLQENLFVLDLPDIMDVCDSELTSISLNAY